MRGVFITVEGPDGAGKTTLIEGLMEKLQGNLRCPLVFSREPGGEAIAEQIRSIILDTANTAMDKRAEALLYAASRRQHLVGKILPALEAGSFVLCDRFVDSSFAYQGYGRQIGGDEVLELNQFATEGLQADLTLYCDLPAEEGIRRINEYRSQENNRLDRESMAFHHRVVEGYQELLRRYPDRIIAIDAQKSPQEMLQQALEALYQRYPAYFKSKD